jgi:hypothetical protein
MKKFTKERYIVLQDLDSRMLTRPIAIIRMLLVIMRLPDYGDSAWFLLAKSGN